MQFDTKQNKGSYRTPSQEEGKGGILSRVSVGKFIVFVAVSLDYIFKNK